MTIEEIKSAINRCNLEIECMKEALARYAKIETMTQKAIEEMKEDEIFLNQSETIKKVLENELERLENKPLDLEELREMIGEPVWGKSKIVANSTYTPVLVHNVLFRGAIEIVQNNPFYSFIVVKYDDFEFLKYKPQEVQDV